MDRTDERYWVDCQKGQTLRTASNRCAMNLSGSTTRPAAVDLTLWGFCYAANTAETAAGSTSTEPVRIRRERSGKRLCAAPMVHGHQDVIGNNVGNCQLNCVNLQSEELGKILMYAFSIVVEGFDLDSEDQNAAIEYLPYDVLASRSGGVTSLDVECEALSASDAVMRAYDDLTKIGAWPVRIDLDLVGLSDISERIGSNRETVRLWSTGARRSDFPVHFAAVGGSRVWAWAEVHNWLLASSIAIDSMFDWEPIPVDVVEAFNGAFAQNRDQSNEGWIAPAVPSVALPFARASNLVTRTGWKSFA